MQEYICQSQWIRTALQVSTVEWTIPLSPFLFTAHSMMLITFNLHSPYFFLSSDNRTIRHRSIVVQCATNSCGIVARIKIMWCDISMTNNSHAPFAQWIFPKNKCSICIILMCIIWQMASNATIAIWNLLIWNCIKHMPDRTMAKTMKNHSNGNAPNVVKCEYTYKIDRNRCLFFIWERNFVFFFRPNRLKNRGSLNMHLKIHQNERPFVCSICDLKFVQKVNLIQHEKTHNEVKDDKPHTCNKCGKW